MDFLSGSVRIARIAGINVRVHVLYLLWMAFQLLSARDEWKFELAFMGMLFGIVLIHEFGHCIGARMVGGDAENILMWPLGGLAYAHAPMRPWPQFVTIACGPLVNVIFCAVSAAVLIYATGTRSVVSLNPFHAYHSELMFEMWQLYVGIFYSVNLMLLAFNLLPIFPFDGGQLLRSIIWPKFGLRGATIFAAKVGIGGCVLLAAWGVYQLQQGGGFMLILIALFGGQVCFQHLMAAEHGMLVEDLTGAQMQRPRRKPGFLARLFQSRRGVPPVPHPRPSAPPVDNPNPGGWERKVAEEQRLDDEVDRILRKVKAEGLRSLSYIERQTLEYATRKRRDEEEHSSGRESRL